MIPGSSRFPSRCWIQRVQEPGSGPVVNAHHYTPYGDPLTDPVNTPGDRGYLGKTHDATGDIRLDHRSFSGTTGLFTSPDPVVIVANPSSFNPYAYGGMNPLAQTDPSGLVPIATTPGEPEPEKLPYFPPTGSGGTSFGGTKSASGSNSYWSASNLIGSRQSFVSGAIGAAAETVDALVAHAPGYFHGTDLGAADAWEELAELAGIETGNFMYDAGGWSTLLVPGGSGAAGTATRLPKFLALFSKFKVSGSKASAPAANTVPSRIARVVPEEFGGAPTLGRPGTPDVFVTAPTISPGSPHRAA